MYIMICIYIRIIYNIIYIYTYMIYVYIHGVWPIYRWDIVTRWQTFSNVGIDGSICHSYVKHPGQLWDCTRMRKW